MQARTASITAQMCAYLRGREAERQDRLFNDYLALQLLSKKEHRKISDLVLANANSPALVAMSAVPIARSVWAEGHLKCFAQGRSQVQYLILGAGLDTFAWRNRNKNISVFEVDHPLTQNLKKTRVANLRWHSTARTFFISVDFERDDLVKRLLEDGFKPKLPTLISILGVSYYLPFKAFAATLVSLSELLQGPSRILFDYQHQGYEEYLGARILADFTASLGENMAKGYSLKELLLLLNTLGWQHIEHLDPQDLDRLYFLKRKDGLRAFESVHLLAAGR